MATNLLGDPILRSYTPTLREGMTDWLAKHWFGDNREGTRKAERLVGVADMTPVGMATGMYDAGRDLGQGNYGMGLAGIGLAAMPIPGEVKQEAKQGIRAFHGSPHDFNAFDTSKIGTGEGAQAYGHGLYFSDKEGVAKSYRDELAGMDVLVNGQKVGTSGKLGEDATAVAAYQLAHGNTPKDIERMVKGWVDSGYRRKGQDDEMIREAHRLSQENAKIEKKPAGKMYEVSINAHPDQFLDWDKPVNEQNPAVIEKLQKLPELGQYAHENAKTLAGALFTPHRAETTDQMKAAGIPGIKYLDQGSRAAGDGSRNYVVFDDKLVTILKKYGLVGLLGGGAGGASLLGNQQQNGLLGGGA